ncbi:hypothetical protein ACFXKR_16960 [Streptomyces violascens]|uniref:hypothetical protein n=1 Tax=Streptomyces violascens TaxID=67381 RepID=UPI0036B20E9E
MFNRQQKDDGARSQRLYESAQDLYDYAEPDSSEEEFAVVVYGSMKAQARAEAAGAYPPKGHNYPRRDR